jgi:hypothetical protein
MTNTDFSTEDLERFAEYMGFDGIDSDLFYETYYKMNEEHDEYEMYWEEYSQKQEMN